MFAFNMTAGYDANVTSQRSTTDKRVVDDVTTEDTPTSATDDVSVQFLTAPPSEQDETINQNTTDSATASVTLSLMSASMTSGNSRLLSVSADKMKYVVLSELQHVLTQVICCELKTYVLQNVDERYSAQCH